MRRAVAVHWPEYLIEAGGLGMFMAAAVGLTALLEHPASPVTAAGLPAVVRRLLMGVAIGSTAAALIYSPFGQRSGAHFNPAVTFTFWRLGRIRAWDAWHYVLAQVLGGLAGVWVAASVLAGVAAHPSVRFASTVPGPYGPGAALAAEGAMTYVLMLFVLVVSNQPRFNRYTGLVVALLLGAFITAEAPVSGMSLNPARSLASAVPAHRLDVLWIYVLAPAVGMLMAAETYLRWPGASRVLCAKLHHDNDHRCIFNCWYPGRRLG